MPSILLSVFDLAVSNTIGMWLVVISSRRARTISIPSIPGIITSLTMISGWQFLLFSKPDFPFSASITLKCWMKMVFRKKRSSWLSSTIRILSFSLSMYSCPLSARRGSCEVWNTCPVSVITWSDRINSVVSSKWLLPLGSLMVNRLPSPGWLCRLMCPWCISTSSFTSDSPMPVLDWLNRFLSIRFSKRTNNDFCLSSAMPMPWSSTVTATSVSVSVITVFICLPCGVYLKALDNRLNRIFSSLSVSAQMWREASSVFSPKSIWCSSAR